MSRTPPQTGAWARPWGEHVRNWSPYRSGDISDAGKRAGGQVGATVPAALGVGVGRQGPMGGNEEERARNPQAWRWQRRMGVEPTRDRSGDRATVLKTVRPTGTRTPP